MTNKLSTRYALHHYGGSGAYSRFIRGIRGFKRLCNLENLFTLKDPDVHPKKSVEIAIVIHLVVLILVVLPFDLLFSKKVEKPKGVKISLMMASGTQSSASQVVTSDASQVGETIIEDKRVENTVVQKPEPKVEKIDPKDIKQPPKKDDKINNFQAGQVPVKDTKPQQTQAKSLDSKPKQEQKPVSQPASPIANQSQNQTSSPLASDKVSDKYADVADVQGVSSADESRTIVNDKGIISSNLHACWTATQVNARITPDIIVTAVVHFSIDGIITGYEIQERKYGNPNQVAAYLSAKDAAKVALEKCKHIKGLNREKYATWQTVKVDFKYSKIDL